MISIIVCSVNKELFRKFEERIENTIGLPYEIIRIDNGDARYGICDAYNLGAESAKYPYLCFAHEDILFETLNWGMPLIELFVTKDAGIIGVAGSKYKSLSPGAWPCGSDKYDCYHLIQHYPKGKELQLNNPDKDKEYSEVKILDGVLMFTSFKIWNDHKFDGYTFKGFHSYDLDFCLQVGQTKSLFVSYNLLIAHLSTGKLDQSWIAQSILLSKKWKHHLPAGILSVKEQKTIEWAKKRHFCLSMLIYGSTFKNALTVFFDYGYLKFFSLQNNLSFFTEICRSYFNKLKLKLNNNLKPTK